MSLLGAIGIVVGIVAMIVGCLWLICRPRRRWYEQPDERVAMKRHLAKRYPPEE